MPLAVIVGTKTRQARFRVRSRPTSRACGSSSNPRASGLNCSKMGGTQHASLGRARRELGNEGILSATDALFIAGLTSSTRSGTQAELFGALMCDTAKYASHSFDERLSMEVPVLHFDLQSLHQIKDTEPHSWATVRADDATTFSELARCGFHLIDMRGETWMMHRE